MQPSQFALTRLTVAGERHHALPALTAGFALNRPGMVMPGRTAAHVVLGAQQVSRRNVQLELSEIWKELPT